MTKTILITGATDGIGLKAAERLAADGHRVLLHGRNAAKLKAAAGGMAGETETYLADLSRLPDVRSLAERVAAAHSQIDVLINNAGVFKTSDPSTPSGIDVRFVVNTIAPYALTRALLARIPPEGRIVNLSSAAQAQVDVDALTGHRPLGDMEAYSQSKLGITIWSQALARDLPNGPSVVAVNPGSLLATKMVTEGFGVAGSDVTIGSGILVRAALSPDFEGVSGSYFDNDSGRFAAPHRAAGDPDQVREVMAALERLIA
ncbi:MAG: SDR family NAD(P)-dependent oxidoreductase [Pseudomonadota bacterium]